MTIDSEDFELENDPTELLSLRTISGIAIGPVACRILTSTPFGLRMKRYFLDKTINTQAVNRALETLYKFDKSSDDVNSLTYKDVVNECCELMRQLREVLKSHDVRVCSTVISVPVFFQNKQKHALRDAAQAANFNVLRVISDAKAIAYAYGLEQALSNNQSGSRPTLVFGCDTNCAFARIYEIPDDAFEPRCLVYDRNVDENSIDGEVQPARLIAVAKSVIDKSLAAANYSVEAIESVAIGGSKASSPEIQDMLHAKFKRGILKTIDPSKVISVGALVTAADLADRI